MLAISHSKHRGKKSSPVCCICLNNVKWRKEKNVYPPIQNSVMDRWAKQFIPSKHKMSNYFTCLAHAQAVHLQCGQSARIQIFGHGHVGIHTVSLQTLVDLGGDNIYVKITLVDTRHGEHELHEPGVRGLFKNHYLRAVKQEANPP